MMYKNRTQTNSLYITDLCTKDGRDVDRFELFNSRSRESKSILVYQQVSAIDNTSCFAFLLCIRIYTGNKSIDINGSKQCAQEPSAG